MPEAPDTTQLQDAAQTIESAQQMLDSAESVLPAAMLVVFTVMVGVGLLLWLLGGKLARAACVMSGLVMGGIAGWVVGAMFKDDGAYILPLVVGGAIIGALLAGLLFRIWVAVVGAGVLALVVPIASLVWNGATVQPVTVDQEAFYEDVRPQDGEDASIYGWSRRALDAGYTQLSDDATAWWEGLGNSGRRMVYLGVIIGAVIGLGLGMVLPKLSAALQTAIAGSLLIYFGGVGLIGGLADPDVTFLPDTARAAVITIGLITALGTVVQWTIFRRQTDK